MAPSMDKDKKIQEMIREVGLDKEMTKERLKELTTYLKSLPLSDLGVESLKVAKAMSENSKGKYSIGEMYQAMIDY
jgi:galactitol-specific phosphotransferase system IIB component